MTALGDQLRARQLSAKYLVDLGIAPERADKLVFDADPTVDEVRRVAKALRLHTRILIDVPDRVGSQQFKLRRNFTRAVADLTGLAVADLADRANWLGRILESRIDDRHRVQMTADEKTPGAAEELAALVRDRILKVEEDQPLIELDRLLCDTTDIFVLATNERQVDGALFPLSNISIVFIARRNAPRMRFTLAHELAHYLVDVTESDPSGWVDADVLEDPQPDLVLEERFANAFASALLLPAGGIGRALVRFREDRIDRDKSISDIEIMFLARLFGVNFQVVALRLEQLTLLPRGSGQALYENATKMFGSPEKMADNAGLPPEKTMTGVSALVLSSSGHVVW